MERPNPFYRRSRISAKKFRQLLRLFALDLTATDAAQLTGLTRKTVTTIFLKIRERIAEECERASPLSNGEVEVDEAYFGARRVRGKRGRGASGKSIVFGLLKRDGKGLHGDSYRTAKRSRCKPLFAGGSRPKRSSTQMAGAATTAWLTWATRSTSESTTGRASSSEARTTSTASRASGVMLNIVSSSFMA